MQERERERERERGGREGGRRNYAAEITSRESNRLERYAEGC